MFTPQNPVLQKELFLRMRWRQSKPTKIGIFALIVLGLVYFHYLALDSLFFAHHERDGATIYQLTFAVQFLLMGLIAPALTANAISQEREQQTWEMLLVSRLTVGEILWGKLLARCAPLLLILLVGMPLASIGWETYQMSLNSEAGNGYTQIPTTGICFWLNYAALASMGAFFATFAFYLSLRLKRTLFAMLGSYAFTVGFLCIGTLLITGSLQLLFAPRDSHFMENFPLMWLNPLAMLSGLVEGRQTNYPQALAGAGIYALLTALLLRMTFTRFTRYAYER